MPRTLGVEEEFLLVDATTADLATRAPEVLRAVGDTSLGDDVTAELNECQVEINGPPAERLDDLHAGLVDRRRALTAAAADAAGVVPAPLATHPWSSWMDQRVNTRKEHYARLVDDYRLIAREQVVCGLHVHVEAGEGDARIDVMNRVRPWLPVLLALSANSPYWEGRDTRYASFRTMVWKRWPTATVPPVLDGDAAYRRLVDDLQRAEAIDEPGSIYWYVRPSAHAPTLEFRVCDVCLDPADAADVVRRLLDEVAPALVEAGDERFVRHRIDGLLGAGTGADRQRRALPDG